MSWRDQLQPGSFRGARFSVDDHTLGGGRRLAVHQYPHRDLPYAEDLGRQEREFTLECYVIGDDYMTDREALVSALEQFGPGNLVHPWLGSQRVAVRSYRLRESTREGGMAFFSISFVESGELTYPDASNNTIAGVATAADAANTSVLDDFANTFSVDGLPEGLITEIEEELSRTLIDLESIIGDVTKTIAAEIRSPYNMGALILGSISTISALVSEPLNAFKLYENLFNAGSDSPTVAPTTADRKQQAINNQAIHTITQRGAVIEASRSSSQASYASRDDALSIRDQLFAAIDTQMEVTDINGQPITDNVYLALVALRARVAEDLRIRATQLPNLSTYIPATTLPALVIAHDIYGDATRADELLARNKIRHPGFVVGGETLEVLNA